MLIFCQGTFDYQRRREIVAPQRDGLTDAWQGWGPAGAGEKLLFVFSCWIEGIATPPKFHIAPETFLYMGFGNFSGANC